MGSEGAYRLHPEKHKMYLLKKNNDITELECICVQRWANRYLAPIFGIGVYTK